MKIITTTMMAAGLALSLNVSAGSMSGDGSMNMTFSNSAEAIQAAMDAWNKAKSVSGEWRDTAKMIREAKKLADDGKEQEAIDLANQARMQGEAGYRQMVGQEGKPASL